MRDRIIITAAACIALGLGMTAAFANPAPIIIAGSSGPDVLVGGNRPEIIIGFAGNDVLAGGRKDDILRGGAGRDRLVAWGTQSGVDRLIGGAGFDRCVGGPEDTFRPSCELKVIRNADGSFA